MKKADKIRFLMSAAADSPTTFPGFHLHGAGNGVYSPMTELSMNLNDATLANSPLTGVTPRRRLSLSSEGTPTPNRCNFLNAGDRHMTMDYASCDKENGLLKSAIKFPGVRGDTSYSRTAFRKMQPPVGDEPAPLDKENHRRDAVELSAAAAAAGAVAGPSPVKCLPSPSKFAMMRHASRESPRRAPLEDHDPNSQDSGYGNSQDAKIDPKTGFRFAEPFGLAPRRQLSEQSPMKENSLSPHGKFRPPSSSSSSSSFGGEDGFAELFDADADSAPVDHLPAGMGSLLSKPILSEDGGDVVASNAVRSGRPPMRRSVSLYENVTPNLSRARSCLFRATAAAAAGSPMQLDEPAGGDVARAFKRPSAPSDEAADAKRIRVRHATFAVCIDAAGAADGAKKCTAVLLKRSFSETQATIMKALHRSTTEPDLIGDFTLPYALPLMEGRHQDLKTISTDTLARLMAGAFADRVETFTIVDCRYPYEFDGGHIRGARNVFTRDQVERDFVEDVALRGDAGGSGGGGGGGDRRKHIIVFHCEFSSERGPNLYRFLRNSDRARNKEVYPALFHPEMYLLDGGYKRFFETHPPLCEPCDYRPMLDPGHEGDLRRFRAKSKSWTGDGKSRLALRSGLKRLGL